MAICSHHLSLMQYLILHTDNMTELWMLCKSLAAGIRISAKHIGQQHNNEAREKGSMAGKWEASSAPARLG